MLARAAAARGNGTRRAEAQSLLNYFHTALPKSSYYRVYYTLSCVRIVPRSMNS